jgi:hypothetical protein
VVETPGLLHRVFGGEGEGFGGGEELNFLCWLVSIVVTSCEMEIDVLHLASTRGRWARGGRNKGRGGCEA